MKLRMMTAVLSAVFLFTSVVAAAAADSAMALAERLLAIPELKESLIASAGQSAPPGTGAEIAMLLFRNDERIWKTLASELPPFLQERIPVERLDTLAKAYGENPEREWAQSGAEMLALIRDLAAADSQLKTAMAISGCSAGLLAPNIDTAREKAGKSGTPFKATPEFFELIQPVVRPIGETCDCVIRRGKEKFGEKFFSDQMPQEERGSFMQQLLVSGECPKPFAGMG